MQEYKHAGFTFKVRGRIGGGSFGEVFEVEIPRQPYLYALKTYQLATELEGVLGDKTNEIFLERFKQEIRYQSECMHDNIVKILAFSRDSAFFVMERAEKDLRTLLNEGILTKKEKIQVTLDVLHGLEYLHQKGLLHRDLKPENILKSKGRYQISDFGLIKNTKDNNSKDVVTAIGTIMGSGKYRAPEILEAAVYTEASDIYAIGAIMSDLSINELDDVMRKCTAYTPRDRYKSVSDVISAVKKRI